MGEPVGRQDMCLLLLFLHLLERSNCLGDGNRWMSHYGAADIRLPKQSDSDLPSLELFRKQLGYGTQ